MRWTRSFPILILLILITACGKRETNGKKIISLNEEKLQRIVEDQNFECDAIDGGSCPSGVSRLVIYNAENPAESALCSGFLISNNLLVTNNHCVSTELECKNTYVSIYAGESLVRAKCDSIVHTEVDNQILKKKKIDLSVLKLDREISLQPLPLSKENLIEGDSLKAWVVDHLSFKKARITELRCEYQGNETSLKLKRCPIIEGNSGSPLLNAREEVVGVMWGSTVDETISANFPIIERRKLEEFGFATSVNFFRDFINY